MSGVGNTLAAGAPGEASAAAGVGANQSDDSAPSAGAAYVFTRTGDNWSQQAYFKAFNPESNDTVGQGVALSANGDTLAVSAGGEDSSAAINGDGSDNSAPASGAVYVFTRSTGVWAQDAYLKAVNVGAGDQFGWSLALSNDGKTVAVGAPMERSAAYGIGGDPNNDSSAGAGAAYLFTRTASGWAQSSYLKASNTDAGDYFGYALALSGDGNTLAVGAPLEASTATGIGGNQSNNGLYGAGAVYLY